MANIVLAPSGAGKTFFSIRYPGIAVDGDLVVKQAHGWPEGRWWETMSVEERLEIHARNEDALTDFAHEHPDFLILFNGRWSNPGIVYAVVIPDEDQHRANVEAKAARGVTTQPNKWSEVTGNRDRLARFASTQAIPIYTSFEVMAKRWMEDEGLIRSFLVHRWPPLARRAR